MTITYIPDNQFHADIDVQLQAENLTDKDREERDFFLNETKLGIEEVWPESWKTLHKDRSPEDVAKRIVAQRRARR